MTADLVVAIERLDIAGGGEGLIEASGWWAGDASVSFVAWLRAHGRMTRRSAQRLRTLAVRLRSLPVCAQAYAEGLLSGGQIEAIVALLDDETVPIFAAQEAELVPYLVPLTVAGVSRAMGAWVSRGPARADRAHRAGALAAAVPHPRGPLGPRRLARPRSRRRGLGRPAPGHARAG